MIKKLFFTLSFFIVLLSASEYPKTFTKLSTPLFESTKKFTRLEDLQSLKPEIQKYQKKVILAIENGKKIDETKDKKEIKNYLLQLRKLQKSYDFLLHLIHKEIEKSIQKKEYNNFVELTSLDLYGLLQNKNLYNKAVSFYQKNRHLKKNNFLEEKISKEALLDATNEEFYKEIVESSYISSTGEKQARKSVYIYTERVNNEIEVYLENLNSYDVTVALNAEYKNIVQAEKTSKEFVIKAKTKLFYTKLYLTKAQSSYAFSYSWIIGNMNAVHDDEYLYRFPYAKGTSQRISQGYNGKQTHKGNSKYALDFAMKEGTRIYAAREGRVVRTKSDSNIGGYDRKFASHGNFVTIAHSDGTLANYYHLKHGGVLVKVGANVSRGEAIAYSGNTGYSSGPHLHFTVFTAMNARKTNTIATKFLGVSGVIEEAKKGKLYKAQ